jgi:hypothetical protein
MNLVRKYFHYPVSEAAELLSAELGHTVSCRSLQRRLRVFGIKQWPYQQAKRGPTRVPRASPAAVVPAVNTVADVGATQQHTFPVTRSHSPMGSAGLHQTEAEFHGRYYEHTFAADDVMDNDETAGYGDQEFTSLVVSAYGDCKPHSLRVSVDVKYAVTLSAYVCSYAVSVPSLWLVSHRVADVMHRVHSVPLDALPDLCGVDQVKCSQSRQTRAAVCMLGNMC